MARETPHGVSVAEVELARVAAAVVDAPTPERARSTTPSRLRFELALIGALWRRDMLRLVRDTARWLGVVLQPLLLWVLLGSGLASVFTIEGIAGLDYFQFFYPGLLVMIVLFTTIFAMMAVIEDRESGFLQQVLTAPGSRASLVLGKTAGVATVAFLQVLLTLLVAPLAGFDLLAVHWPLLLLVFVLGTVALTALSFSLAWVLRSTAGYHAVMAMLLLPLWLISGAMFPPREGWLEVIMTANPMTYMVDGFRHALHGGEAPVALAGPAVAVAVLAGATALFVGLALFVSRARGGGAT